MLQRFRFLSFMLILLLTPIALTSVYYLKETIKIAPRAASSNPKGLYKHHSSYSAFEVLKGDDLSIIKYSHYDVEARLYVKGNMLDQRNSYAIYNLLDHYASNLERENDSVSYQLHLKNVGEDFIAPEFRWNRMGKDYKILGKKFNKNRWVRIKVSRRYDTFLLYLDDGSGQFEKVGEVRVNLDGFPPYPIKVYSYTKILEHVSNNHSVIVDYLKISSGFSSSYLRTQALWNFECNLKNDVSNKYSLIPNGSSYQARYYNINTNEVLNGFCEPSKIRLTSPSIQAGSNKLIKACGLNFKTTTDNRLYSVPPETNRTFTVTVTTANGNKIQKSARFPTNAIHDYPYGTRGSLEWPIDTAGFEHNARISIISEVFGKSQANGEVRSLGFSDPLDVTVDTQTQCPTSPIPTSLIPTPTTDQITGVPTPTAFVPSPTPALPTQTVTGPISLTAESRVGGNNFIRACEASGIKFKTIVSADAIAKSGGNTTPTTTVTLTNTVTGQKLTPAATNLIRTTDSLGNYIYTAIVSFPTSNFSQTANFSAKAEVKIKKGFIPLPPIGSSNPLDVTIDAVSACPI